MTLSSRLVSFAAATAITAVTFAGPTFAAPRPALHQITVSAASH
jgi:hypothetical protein